MKMIKTDMLIIGAGPTGLFTIFEGGLLKVTWPGLTSMFFHFVQTAQHKLLPVLLYKTLTIPSGLCTSLRDFAD